MCSRISLCAINGRIKRNCRNHKCATVPEIRSIYRLATGRRSRGGGGTSSGISLQLYGSSSNDDCQGYVSSFERFVAETLVRQFEFSIVARRPNRIAETCYTSDVSLSFFLSSLGSRRTDVAAYVGRIIVLALIFAKQHFVIVLGYSSAMYPSSAPRNIVRYRCALHFEYTYMQIRIVLRSFPLFFPGFHEIFYRALYVPESEKNCEM